MIGASMHDAARTRENEQGCCCDGCDEDPCTCGKSWLACEEALIEASADAAADAWRDER